MSESTFVSIRLSPEAVRRVREYAALRDISMSEAGREIIEQFDVDSAMLTLLMQRRAEIDAQIARLTQPRLAGEPE